MIRLLLLPLTALLMAAAANADTPPSNFSEAERALFMSKHLAGTKPPATLRYGFHKSGSLEPGFDDKVTLAIAKSTGGQCCTARAEFLAGPRRLDLPEVDNAEGNPVILYFLERDVREMSRLTKGQASYFRKRIRMAVFQGATVRPVSLTYAGKTINGREIAIAPYVDDPLRPRFEKLAGKQYVFTLSDAVPGGVVAIRSFVKEPGGGETPLLQEQLLIDGAARQP